MTKIISEEDGFLILEAVSKEEDLHPKCRVIGNRPPEDGRCEVCGRHMSELTPFGGPEDPLPEDFTGELLVKIWGREAPYDEEVEKACKEAEKETRGGDEILPWLISKYGEEKAKQIFGSWQLYDTIGAWWVCRDCVVLDEDEYFQRFRETLRNVRVELLTGENPKEKQKS